jgi:hypothetical protein
MELHITSKSSVKMKKYPVVREYRPAQGLSVVKSGKFKGYAESDYEESLIQRGYQCMGIDNVVRNGKKVALKRFVSRNGKSVVSTSVIK